LEPIDLMVNWRFVPQLTNYLKVHRIPYHVTIPDVKGLIQHERLAPRFRTLSVTRTGKGHLTMGDYHSYPAIVEWMEAIAATYPNFTQTFTIGKTYEGRPIRGIKIGRPITGHNDKRAVYIDGGIHAREWASIHTAMYFIDQLVGNYGRDQEITDFVNRLNIYIVPCLNPDGYEYSRSSTEPMVRLWRKNRGPCTQFSNCCGVDLNRNFAFHWGEIGSSGNICVETFRGTAPFSEAETRATRDKFLSPELRGHLDVYFPLHLYGQMMLHGWNHQAGSYPSDVAELRRVGMQALRALQSVYGTRYRFGSAADILYSAAGGADDWAKSIGVKYVYLFELRPGNLASGGFMLGKSQLIPTGRETFEAIKVVMNHVIESTQNGENQRKGNHIGKQKGHQLPPPMRAKTGTNLGPKFPTKIRHEAPAYALPPIANPAEIVYVI